MPFRHCDIVGSAFTIIRRAVLHGNREEDEVRAKTLIVVVLLLGAVLAPAQEEQTFVAPWSAPVPDVSEGATLFAVGFWGDVIGLGLVAGAGAAFSLSPGAGSALLSIGFTSMLFVGNPCFQLGLSAHDAAVEDRGFTVSDDNRRKSTLFSRIALGCGGASALLGIGAAASSSLGLGISASVVGLTGAVFEIINFYNYRPAWVADMKEAAGVSIP